MANKIYTFDNPADFSFDVNKIEISEGLVKLKEDLSNVYARWHLNEATGQTVLDTSGNGRNGTPVNNPTSASGKLNNCLSFNGSNQYINCGNIASFERTNSFSAECWFKTSLDRTQFMVAKQDDSTRRGWALYIREAGGNFRVAIILANNVVSNYIAVEHPINAIDNNWHHAVVTYDGSGNANGIKIYVDNDGTGNIVIQNSLSDTIITTATLQIGTRGGSTSFGFQGEIDEVLVYDKELSANEVAYRYNSGSGRENLKYFTDNPTITPTSSWNVSGLSQWFAFTESLGAGNQGNFGYQLSDDDGVTYRYWNGSSWVVTSDQYNSAAVIGANISTFPITNSKILFKAFLISDGTQQCKLDTIEITATVGNPPNVYAGADKSCRDHETKKPFSDAVISDPDGNIENATAYRKIESEVWTQISKGSYGTLQDAIRNFEYIFNNLGQINCELKIVDETAKETIDSMIMTVSKYQVIFNIKDSEGNHLGNVLCNFDDGAGWQIKNSPFTYQFEWKSGNYLCTFDKTGFISQTIEVIISDHTENITLQRLTVDPSAIADAVWDEIKTGHNLTNSFGKEIQDAKIEINKIQLIKDKTDNLPADPASQTLIKRVLGLSQENYRLFDIVYSNSLVTSAKIKIYNSGTDCAEDINPLATYNVNAEYDLDGKLLNYQVIKIS